MAKHTTSHAQFLMSTRYASYRLGLIDPCQIAPMLVDPLDAPCFKLLVPGPHSLPTSLLIDPDFQEGAIYGYLNDDPGETPAGVANWVWKEFYRTMRDDANARGWCVGWILGALSRLAETHRALALVGIAHLAFVLSLVPSLPEPSIFPALCDAHFYHNELIRAFRSEVRNYKASGLTFSDASYAALANFAFVNAPYADGCVSLALHAETPFQPASQYADESEVA